MEHRRIALFGIFSLLLAATPALAAPTGDQAVKGPYRGTYVCQTKMGFTTIFRLPIDLVIRNGNVEFSRPLVSWNGRASRLIGNEMAAGTIDADGKMHLTSTWLNGGAVFHGDYSGTLTPSGGTFMGTQTWHTPRGQNGSRACGSFRAARSDQSVAAATVIARSIAATTIVARSIAIPAVSGETLPPRGGGATCDAAVM